MRAKFAYINKDEIVPYIQDNTLNSADIVYTKDTHENYFISPDLIPIAIKSTIYCFESEKEAEEILNQSSDTYAGQIVSIRKDDVYKGYIVNKSKEKDKYVITSLEEDTTQNIYGSFDENLFLTDAETGKITLSDDVITQKDTVVLYGGSATEVIK